MGYQLCPYLTYTNVYNPRQEWLRQLQLLLIIIIYVSNPDRLIRTHVPVISMSDHYPVCCTLSCQIPKAKAGKHTTVTYRSYKHFDTGPCLCDLSNTSFDAIYGLSDPDEALVHFYQLFLLVYDKHVPIRRQRVKQTGRCFPGSQLTFDRLWSKGTDLRSRKSTLNWKSKKDTWNV